MLPFARSPLLSWEAIERLQPYDDLWELVYRWTSEARRPAIRQGTPKGFVIFVFLRKG